MDEGRERANSGTEKKKPTEKTNKRRNKEGRQKGRDKLLPRRAGEVLQGTRDEVSSARIFRELVHKRKG